MGIEANICQPILVFPVRQQAVCNRARATKAGERNDDRDNSWADLVLNLLCTWLGPAFVLAKMGVEIVVEVTVVGGRCLHSSFDSVGGEVQLDGVKSMVMPSL